MLRYAIAYSMTLGTRYKPPRDSGASARNSSARSGSVTVSLAQRERLFVRMRERFDAVEIGLLQRAGHLQNAIEFAGHGIDVRIVHREAGETGDAAHRGVVDGHVGQRRK